MADTDIDRGDWADSRECLGRAVRHVVDPPERVLSVWAGPPGLALHDRSQLRAKLLMSAKDHGLRLELLFGLKGLSERVLAWGPRARALFDEDLQIAGDDYWWGNTALLTTDRQDLTLVLWAHPDGADLQLVAWGPGCEELLSDLAQLLR